MNLLITMPMTPHGLACVLAHMGKVPSCYEDAPDVLWWAQQLGGTDDGEGSQPQLKAPAKATSLG